MAEQGISSACKAESLQNQLESGKYKKLFDDDEKKCHNLDDCVQQHVVCRAKCEKIEETKDDKDQAQGDCKTPDAPLSPEECYPKLQKWNKLAELTGTRPTVGNFTIARYSSSEWEKRNDNAMKESKYEIREAKNLDYKEKLLEVELCRQIDKQQFTNTLSLTQRAREIFHWKAELTRISEELEIEIVKINSVIQRLLRASQAVKMIKKINSDIQKVRNTRMQADLVHDSPAEEIIKENDLCNEILNLYSRCIEEARKLLVELKDAKQRLEYDWSDKNQAYAIDTNCIGLRNESDNLEWKPGCVRLPDGQSTPNDWTKFVKNSIILAKTAGNRSEVLRLNTKESIDRSVKDLRKQAASVDFALTDNINRLIEACRNSENLLKDCLRRLADNELLINRTSCAVKRLDEPMKCAQTRLASRLSRENMENCRDQSQCGLICEIKNISNITSNLSGQMKSAQDSTETLKDRRKKLESDIITKKKSLWIDRERCKFMRTFYPSTNALSGYQ